MNLHKLIFTKSSCYKRNVEKYDDRYTTFQDRGPKGIMVHSTGANNPWLNRYVGPDDGLLGKNFYGNHWNVRGLSVCVHAFIGKLKDGTVATYQTLPWNYRAWHCAGDANNTHISFEICEDNLKDAKYFKKVYQEAVELTAMLCKEYNLDPLDDGVVICHSEGYQRGIASNHSDVMHWFPKYGKSMDTFRKDVKAAMDGKPVCTVKEWQLAAIADGFKFPKYGADGMWGAECVSVATKAVVKKRLIYTNKNLTRIVQKAVGANVDGLFGNNTKKAVIAYQNKHGLVADGEVGLNTWKKILNIK